MRAFRRMAYAALPVLVLACGSDDPTAEAGGAIRQAATATLSPPTATIDSIGGFIFLTLTVLDQNGEAFDRPPQAVVWRSSDPFVATVTPQGGVTARDYGTTTITAAMDDHGGMGQDDIEADALVTVVEP